MRFAHIADTHIRNLKYHKEYRAVFQQLYKKLEELDVDYIIHCGDIAHTKTQISPEFVDLCSDFFRNLANIAPTYIILGNHDGNLRNSYRQDALTPIANALDHPNLKLIKNSGEVNLDDTFTLNILSVFDADNWMAPSDSTKTNIALYHGSISNCQTDAGWVMEYGENDISIFDRFDYAFLGDIHKTNQRLDKNGRIRYCGSTVQQNHGETNDKGFLIWDIEDKETFSVEHFVLANPKPFITITLTPKGSIPKGTELPSKARLRLVSENTLPLDTIRKVIDVAKLRFKPEAITYLCRSDGRHNLDNSTNSLIQEDLRDIAVQEGLIEEYIKDYQVDEDVLQKVYDLNKKYNTLVEEEEEVSRNVNWKLKRIEWDNLFNYGEGNSIDFYDMNGVVGILGKNFSGKSSVIDSLLYTLYNTTSKNNRKNYNVINQNKEECRGQVQIDIGTKTYKVERTSKKYVKKLKGKTTNEAKTDVEFTVVDNATGIEQELNGTSRNETDKNIRKIFGTIEDFLMTSMASQLGSLNFISEGSTKRKEILAKFLDLEFFDKKFKMAKEASSDIKAMIRRMQKREFAEEAKDARTELARSEAETSLKQKECKKFASKINKLNTSLSECDKLISSIPTEIIDIVRVNSKLQDLTNKIDILESDKIGLETNLIEKEQFHNKIAAFIVDFDVDSLQEKQELIKEHKSSIVAFESEIETEDTRLKLLQKKVKLLDEVPCGEEYSHCKFIKDAYTAKKNIVPVQDMINKLNSRVAETSRSISDLDPGKLEDHFNKFQKITKKKNITINEINELKLDIEKTKTHVLRFDQERNILKAKKQEYEDNKEAIENLETLLQKKMNLEEDIGTYKKKYETCQQESMELYKQNGFLEQTLEQVRLDEQEYENFNAEFTAFDLFQRCMHSNGISYDIIKKRLPLINEEISKILTNIVDFDILFDNGENKLDILIKHPSYEARPIEMGSGAEKTICAMAIRLALLNVSTLPKGDVFILDEPGTALDEDNMEGFVRILDMIGTQFKTVLLISHLDNLKDTVDQQITIDKIDGYAHINH
jgi:DNA repair exonuclease SbcCD ATPase subunit/DNA repair exonuclease SbcCD nuclease subunit